MKPLLQGPYFLLNHVGLLRKKPESRLIYVDDEYFKRTEEEARLEMEPGAFGYHGYYMDMRGLRKGLYPGNYMVWYAAPPFKVGDHVKYLDEYDHPIQVKATEAGKKPGDGSDSK